MKRKRQLTKKMDQTDGTSSAQQRWFADRYAANARFVSDLAEPLIEILAPGRDEVILDLGCGDGALTKLLVDAGAKAILESKGDRRRETILFSQHELEVRAAILERRPLVSTPSTGKITIGDGGVAESSFKPGQSLNGY